MATSTDLVGPVRWVPGVAGGLTARDADDLMRRIARTVWPDDPSLMEERAYAAGVNTGFAVAQLPEVLLRGGLIPGRPDEDPT